MPRYCFQLQVKPDRIAEYRERHAAVWPEMLRALAETGWHNYSLFLRPDGLLIGYVESDDLAAAQAAMDATDVNARWQAEMASSSRTSTCPPDQGFVLLEEVFHLEDQLAALDDPPTEPRKPTMTTFADITGRLESLAIEVPSWAYGNSGTRFKVFGSPGTPRTVEEKIADAAAVHRFTGLAPTVALHIPWDLVDDYAEAADVRRGPRRRARHHQLQHLPGRRLQARQPDQRRPGDPQEGGAAQPRLHRGDERDRLARPEDLAGRRHQLPRPGRHPDPPGLAGRGPRRDLRPDRRRTSGWCWSTSSSSRRSTTPTCRTGARRTCTVPPSETGPWCASTPATTRPAPTSSSSSPSSPGSGSSARSTSTAASTPTTT